MSLQNRQLIFKKRPMMYERNMIAEAYVNAEMSAILNRCKKNNEAREKIKSHMEDISFIEAKVEAKNRKMKEFSVIHSELFETKSCTNKLLYVIPRLKKAARTPAHWQIIESATKDIVVEMIQKMQNVKGLREAERILDILKQINKKNIGLNSVFEALRSESFVLKAKTVLWKKRYRRPRRRI